MAFLLQLVVHEHRLVVNNGNTTVLQHTISPLGGGITTRIEFSDVETAEALIRQCATSYAPLHKLFCVSVDLCVCAVARARV